MKQLVKPYDGKRLVRFHVEGSGEIQTFTLLSKEFRSAMKLLGIKLEYIQKHTPEDNGDIESFHIPPLLVKLIDLRRIPVQ